MTPTKRRRPVIKIVVDTNIIFSGLLNANGTIGDLIFNSDGVFEFFSCNYMRTEIDTHWGKLRKISKLSEAELNESRFKMFGKINFINEELIPPKTWLKSEQLVEDIDVDDVDFVALTTFLKGHLWTGDKDLYSGLKAKTFNTVYNTVDMVAIRTARTE